MLVSVKVAIIAGIILLVGSVVAIITVYFLSNNSEEKGCDIYPFEVDLHPLVIKSGTSDFIYPNPGEKVLRFNKGQSLDFICPGTTVVAGKLNTNNSVVVGSCVSGSNFKIINKEIDWKDLSCSGILWRTIKYTGNTCENNGRVIEVGFDTGDERFLRSLLICFNQELQIAYYTYINQTASIKQRVLGTPRPAFITGTGFYNIGNVNSLYIRNNQRTTINRLVGLPDNSTKYIKDNSNYFLARGHLTARSDGFYAAQQNATFFYQNIAPQWQTFNGFNWNQIEIDVREYAESMAVDLQVWTGVHGVSMLPHESTGQLVQLYLFVNTTNEIRALSVPEIFWKVAYNPVTERGIALIGVNNPYNSTFTTLCNDVSDRLKWFHCKKDNQENGFCYACRIDTFRRVVTTMPYVPDRGLLL